MLNDPSVSNRVSAEWIIKDTSSRACDNKPVMSAAND